jgi:hypothetical protein
MASALGTRPDERQYKLDDFLNEEERSLWQRAVYLDQVTPGLLSELSILPESTRVRGTECSFSFYGKQVLPNGTLEPGDTLIGQLWVRTPASPLLLIPNPHFAPVQQELCGLLVPTLHGFELCRFIRTNETRELKIGDIVFERHAPFRKEHAAEIAISKRWFPDRTDSFLISKERYQELRTFVKQYFFVPPPAA